MTRFITGGIAAATLVLAAPVAAHVSLENPEAAAGRTTKIVLRVPHGCDGQATNTVRIRIPEGVHSVKPMPKAGWTLETVAAAGAGDHGAVAEVVWSGGDLPDAFYDEFVFRGALADDLAPGTVLWFPTVQICAQGREEWTDVSGDQAASMPAPSLTVAMDQRPDGEGVRVGDLELDGAFTRATPPAAKVGGGYVTIRDTGHHGDRLLSASASFAADTQIHQMAMEGDVMRMRHLPEGVAVPAGGSVELAPGGYHLMFMGLKQPLAAGESVQVTFTFEKAGQVTLTLPVLAAGATGPEHQH